MSTILNPYLNFDGNAREAMAFYHDVLGGELTISTYGDMGMEGELSERVMHSQLKTPAGFTIMAGDLPPDMEHKPGTNVNISISGDDGDALKGYWEKLSARGTVMMPMERQMWGDEFGACVDQFGIHWMVDIVAEGE
ncbi:VOC family protein [Salininema proteolyticum]|uniref:VOC family protein n=1 Tax=Salininema proteolyticum TaxID=1607685 RepID=A0ABV8TWU1_9ACTN